MAFLLLLLMRGVNSLIQSQKALRYMSRLAQAVTIALCVTLALRLYVAIASPFLDWQYAMKSTYHPILSRLAWQYTAYSHLNLL